tara:strand:+ start:30 stop:371 length:342 start_codon:yes stop_codon:yes gene_type:complete
MNVIDNLNTNKYFIGTMMIILTLGGRFIISELDEETKKNFAENSTYRRFLVFCAFFMGTRDILTAILLTIIFAFIMDHFINIDYKEIDDILKEQDNEDNENDENNENNYYLNI